MWENIRKEYQQLGMSDAAIEQMFEYDFSAFKKDFREEYHAVSFPDPNSEDDKEREEALLYPFQEKLSNSYDALGGHSHSWWQQEISSPEITEVLRDLSEEEMELLTRYIFDGVTQKDLAVELHISQQGISKRIGRILSKFTKKIKSQ